MACAHASAIARLSAALAVLAGCQPTTAWPPPPVEGAGGWVLLVKVLGQLEHAYVLAPQAPLPPLRVVGDPQDTVVYAGVYQQSLGVLGIPTGELDLSQAADSPAPLPDRAYALEAPHASWTEGAPSEIFAGFRVPRTPGFCAPYEGYARSEHEVPDSTAPGPFFTENTRLGALMVGNHAGVWEVNPEGMASPLAGVASTSTTQPEDLASRPFVAAHWDPAPGGFQYFYQADGRLWRRVASGNFEWVGQNPGTHDSTYAWLAGSDDKTPFELYVLDDHGHLWRYDGEDWTMRRAPESPEVLGPEGELVWIAPGDVMMIAGGGRILRVRDQTVEDVTPEGMVHATVLLNERWVGVFAGDDQGHLWQSSAGEWTQLPGPKQGPILTISPHNGGYLYGGSGGTLSYFRDEQPGCNDPITTPNSTIFRVASLYEGETLILSSPAYDGAPAPITVTALVPVTHP